MAFTLHMIVMIKEVKQYGYCGRIKHALNVLSCSSKLADLPYILISQKAANQPAIKFESPKILQFEVCSPWIDQVYQVHQDLHILRHKMAQFYFGLWAVFQLRKGIFDPSITLLQNLCPKMFQEVMWVPTDAINQDTIYHILKFTAISRTLNLKRLDKRL